MLFWGQDTAFYSCLMYKLVGGALGTIILLGGEVRIPPENIGDQELKSFLSRVRKRSENQPDFPSREKMGEIFLFLLLCRACRCVKTTYVFSEGWI